MEIIGTLVEIILSHGFQPETILGDANPNVLINYSQRLSLTYKITFRENDDDQSIKEIVFEIIAEMKKGIMCAREKMSPDKLYLYPRFRRSNCDADLQRDYLERLFLETTERLCNQISARIYQQVL